MFLAKSITKAKSHRAVAFAVGYTPFISFVLISNYFATGNHYMLP